MIRKTILSVILSLITILSFSIVSRDCSTNFYGIFSIWLMESTGFHEYSFFRYGFLINYFAVFILWFIILYLFKIKLSNKWILFLIIVLSTLYINFSFKNNIRLHIDSRNIVPKEFLIDTIDKKISFFFINKDIQCPN